MCMPQLSRRLTSVMVARLVTIVLIVICTHATGYPGDRRSLLAPVRAGMDSAELQRVRDCALTGGGPRCVIRHGMRVMAWGNLTQRYGLKSSTKSFGTGISTGDDAMARFALLWLCGGSGHWEYEEYLRRACAAVRMQPESE